MAVLVFLFAFAFVLVVGGFLTGLMAAFVSLMIGFGIVSVAAIAAWYHSSASKGISWLFRLVFAVGGMMGGILGCFIFKLIWPAPFSLFVIILTGILTGAAGGYLSGKLAFRIVRKVYRYYSYHQPQ